MHVIRKLKILNNVLNRSAFSGIDVVSCNYVKGDALFCMILC